METTEILNLRLFRRMVEVFNTGELSDLSSLVSPAYVDHQGIGGLEVVGPDGFAGVVALARQAHPGLRVVIEDLSAAGETVRAQLAWFEPEPTPGAISGTVQLPHRRTLEVVRFADGVAAEHWGERLS